MVSTTNPQLETFTILIEQVTDFIVPLDTRKTVPYISSTSPIFYYIDVADETDLKKTDILEVQTYLTNVCQNDFC